MILITFLGANEYNPTEYEWQGKKKQTALSCVACSEFLKPEQILVFLTKEAAEKNLERLIGEMADQSIKIKTVNIPVGRNEQELWQIFDIITSHVPEDSEIAFDVTNGQRALPMLGLLAATFLKTSRAVKIRHLFYGAFNIDPQQAPGITPIFDLSPMLQLLDWSIAADRFKRFGDSTDIAELLQGFGKKITRENIGNESEQRKGSNFDGMGKKLTEISQSLMLLRPLGLMNAVSRLESYVGKVLPDLASFPEIKPLELQLGDIQRSYSPFSMSESVSMKETEMCSVLEKEKAMISWYQEHGHFMQAVSLAREWLLSWVMLWLGKGPLFDKKERENVNRAINVMLHQQSSITDQDDQELVITSEMIGEFTDPKQFADLWDRLGTIRNDIAHGGHRKESLSAVNLIDQSKAKFEVLYKLPMPGSTVPGASC